MSNAAIHAWHEANQRYLAAALAVEGDMLEHKDGSAKQDLEDAASEMPSAPALETIALTFGLTPFERNVLLACAGPDLDSRFANLCATAHNDPRRTYVSFSLALATLPDAHWSALSPV